MSSEFSPELIKELLDDFYAESDELLTQVRQHLTLLDAALNDREPPPPAALEGLSRSIHTLKGIAAIAGVRAAEELAHHTEDVLRALTRQHVALTPERLDLLVRAVQRLETIITAQRHGKPVPDYLPLLEALQKAASAPAATAGPKRGGSAPEQAVALRARGLTPWRCTFAPSADLDARGINVTVIRQRLGELGEIASGTPNIAAGGKMSFEFIVGFREAPDDLAKWDAEGVQLEPIPEATTPAATAPAEDTVDPLSLAPSHLVRVDLARLDDLMRIAGEMIIQRSRLEERLQKEFRDHQGLREIDQSLARSLRALRRAIARVRLVPIGEIFARIPFVVRDLAADSDKRVRVRLEGQQTEIDKYVAERLKEPLLHLVRNAFSHGVEPTDARRAAGKASEAKLTLRARSLGEWIEIEVEDDGRGVDVDAVLKRARAMGLEVPEQPDGPALLRILCSPGFSVRDEADRAAGRGIGMSVVANTVRELGGLLSLHHRAGQGTCFLLRLPLTLSILDAIILNVNGSTYAAPQNTVDEIVQVPANAIRQIRQTEVASYRGGLLPIIRLAHQFGGHASERPELTILVASTEAGSIGLVVDGVRTRREVVVRALNDPLVRVRGISGATELGDGRPILILDLAAFGRGVVRPALEQELSTPTP
jgi:two-component system, chemotaxis family, sensor kinase CheA